MKKKYRTVRLGYPRVDEDKFRDNPLPRYRCDIPSTERTKFAIFSQTLKRENKRKRGPLSAHATIIMEYKPSHTKCRCAIIPLTSEWLLFMQIFIFVCSRCKWTLVRSKIIQKTNFNFITSIPAILNVRTFFNFFHKGINIRKGWTMYGFRTILFYLSLRLYFSCLYG
jgi:hypothetical protein